MLKSRGIRSLICLMKIDWQRRKIVVALEANDFEADWRGFLAAIRGQIPSRHREYWSDEKTWIIKDRYAPLIDRLARQYLSPASHGSLTSTESREPLISLLPLTPPTTSSGDLTKAELPESLISTLTPSTPPVIGSQTSTSAQDATGTAPPASIPASSTVSLLPLATDSPPRSTLISVEPSTPESTWPFILLSLAFAIIGWWTAATVFPSVWRYVLLRPPELPLFDGIVFGLSAIGGLGSTIYTLWLLFQRDRESRVES